MVRLSVSRVRIRVGFITNPREVYGVRAVNEGLCTYSVEGVTDGVREGGAVRGAWV
jgi:hypothetical protein